MNIVTLDFETYFADDYTLSKMTTEEYVRDPRFEVMGLGVRHNNGEATYYDDPSAFFEMCDLSRWVVLCHHAHFDGLILSHHYHVKPKFWLDTFSMARMLHGASVGKSLESLSKLYNLGAKTVPYNLVKNKHWHELDPWTKVALAEGCVQDCNLTYDLFMQMAKNFPAEEFRLIDMTIRMFTEPELEVDIDLLRKIWIAERDKKKALIDKLGLEKEDLQSADKFAQLLADYGVEEIATKPSPRDPEKQIYAFAKTDQFMQDLLVDEDEDVRTLAEARLGLKSTLNQTRVERIASSFQRGGNVPVYLYYCGAQTNRWSGGDNMNWQNFPRKGDLRKSIKAPKGKKLGVVDLSQIECRVLNTWAGQWDIVEAFRRKEDVYCKLATEIYGYPVTPDMKDERGTGKQGELSCGYGAGPASFCRTAKLGTYGPPAILTLAQGENAVNTYRRTHSAVEAHWKTGNRMIASLAGCDAPVEWGPVTIWDKRIWLPNGACMIYDTLEYCEEWRSWRHKPNRLWKKLYGARLVQNVCEALARLIAGQALLRLVDRGYHAKLMRHDDAVFVIDHEEELKVILEEFTRIVSWMPELPVDAEGHAGETL